MAGSIRGLSTFLLALTFLSACAQDADCQLALPSMSKELSDGLVRKLDEEGVRYKINAKGLVCVSPESYKLIPPLMNNIADQYIHPDRSISADDVLLDRYIQKFKESNMIYQDYHLDKSRYLVWKSEDDQRAREIIENENDRFFNGK